MVSGLTKSYYDTINDISKVIGPIKKSVMDYSIMISKEHNIIFADNAICELPQAQD
jgi:malate dehydrogenase (oxaloacetate-decarboxylating)(NADP+)